MAQVLYGHIDLLAQMPPDEQAKYLQLLVKSVQLRVNPTDKKRGRLILRLISPEVQALSSCQRHLWWSMVDGGRTNT
jgi:hypothetical protein